MTPITMFDSSFLLENSPNPLAVLDNEFRFIAVSKSWKEHYQLSDKNAVGKKVLDLVPHVHKDLEEIYNHCREGKSLIRESVSTDKSENIQWKILPWSKNDKNFGGVIIIRENITEKKRLEEELRSSNEMVKIALTMQVLV